MVLESTVLCVDNTEYMRNGDYPPTRFNAQQDAAGVVISSKILANAENNVGMLSLNNGRMIVNLTQDQGKLLAHLHQLPIEGEMKFITSIKVAQLALKHRQGKNHRTRIVAFVGSPISDDEKELVKLAKRLKKEKVSVDIVLFGQEDSQNSEYLQAFINTLNGKEGQNSRLLTVPPGPSLPDTIMSSAIVRGEDGAGPAPMAAGGQGVLGDLGFDPTEDPELALALRVSMEEQHARQQVNTTAAAAPMSVDNPAAGGSQPATAESSVHDPVLQQALAMSVNAQSNAAPAGGTAQSRTPQQPQNSAPSGSLTRAFDEMNEDEQLAYALQMSMQDAAQPQQNDAGSGTQQQPAPPGGSQKKPDDQMDVDEDKPNS